MAALSRRSVVTRSCSLRYAGPVGRDQVTITLKQSIGATEPLRSGGYAKTVTLTLATTQP